ncbi:hypothetical protein AB0D08_14205 [Kitasatospora sp. NPDC048540]|uniref:hypothetical protein n=1 Tax=Kitasatospora sp. NPDC048540 TaxID=3155634 RepID=UPI0033E84BBC
MARIRTIKPEYPVSEDLASVSLTAERTFLCLITQADDEGRHRDNAAVLNGALWSLRPEHTPLDTEDELRQLAETGLICRYTGCDGRQYLHITKWREHQKISHPTASRLPSCPAHEAGRGCGKCKAKDCARPAPENFRTSPEPVVTAAEALPGPLVGEPAAGGLMLGLAPAMVAAAMPPSGKAAGQSMPPEVLVRTPESFVPGPWTLDHGPSPEGGGFAAPAPTPSSAAADENRPVHVGTPAAEPRVNAGTLLAEYISGCPAPVPAKVKGHLAKVIKELLDTGTRPDHVRAGLALWGEKALSPGLLPSMVHQALNARPAHTAHTGHTAARSPYQPFTNPADARAYFEGDL